MKKVVLLVIAILSVATGFSQNNKVQQQGFGYYGSRVLGGNVIDYKFVNESDVLFSKRIWRELDSKDTANWTMMAPKSMLANIMVSSLLNGELTAYENPDNKEIDFFSKPLKVAEVSKRLADSTFVPVFDRDGNQIGGNMLPQDFDPKSIKKFMIMEDWIFNQQTGTFEVRIWGIAPVVDLKVEGAVVDEFVPFWVYFPEFRYILATQKVALFDNDATNLSYDDWFTRRMFDGKVYKISNPLDLPLSSFFQGDALIKEQKRIDDELFKKLETLTKDYSIKAKERGRKGRNKGK